MPGLTRASIENAKAGRKPGFLSSRTSFSIYYFFFKLKKFSSDKVVIAMASLGIRWTNKESRNYVDILPMALFQSEVTNKDVEHLIRRPNGTTYTVKSTIYVRGNTATLTYTQTNNRANSVWPGTTRITFETNDRARAIGIEWQDQGDINFIDPLPVLFMEDDDQTNASRFFVIKTDPVEIGSGSLSLHARPIFEMNGADISLGDQVFVWTFENKGGRGIEWHGVVQSLDKVRSGIYRIELHNLRQCASNFGATEIDKFRNSGNIHEAGLYKKLKTYSHRGIRCIDKEEAQKLLSLFDAFENDGQSEVARLMRLGIIASRPNQADFSASVRRAYEGKCAFTGCTTAEALEAAHIKVTEGLDDNDLHNGILLRADVHALFDKGLIALTLDGNQIQMSTKLTDPAYGFLRTVKVSQPKEGRPLEANIRDHRSRFGFACS